LATPSSIGQLRPPPKSKDPVRVSPLLTIVTVAVTAPNGPLMVKSQDPSTGEEAGSVAQDDSAESRVSIKMAG
jgi:hypothetical protein